MLVPKEEFSNVIQLLSVAGEYGLDTETHGVGFYDRLFGISIANSEQTYYFDFLHTLAREQLSEFKSVFSNTGSTWYIHNAKFDLQKFELEGLSIAGLIYCTYTNEKLLDNSHLLYNLKETAKRRGLHKVDEVMLYANKNKCYDLVNIPDKRKRVRKYYFDRVPLDLMSNYAGVDAELHYKIGVDQIGSIPESCAAVVENESKLIKVINEMIMTGIRIDEPYIKKAIAHEREQIALAKMEYAAITKEDYGNGGRLILKKTFDRLLIRYPMTDKGNASFDSDALSGIDHPIPKIITRIREHEKNLGTYYSSFLYYSSGHGTIHAFPNQAGTVTGRFSYADPNLQNLPKQETVDAGEFVVRKCFVPREEFTFVMIDYNQMEFRVLLDYAGQVDMINQVLGGVDVHQATADMVGITRKLAKTLNFGLLYGMGNAKLAASLGLTVNHASELRRKYFSRLPRISVLNQNVMKKAASAGWIVNRFGRRYKNTNGFEYKMMNHLIQGTCADVIKFAMTEIYEFLKPYKSRMLVQVHDEILFEIHNTEYHIIESIKQIMERTYKPFNGMTLTCSVEHSRVSWGSCDKVNGTPV
jgi:DNA polymerase-1